MESRGWVSDLVSAFSLVMLMWQKKGTLIKTFVVYALLAHCHCCHIKDTTLLKWINSLNCAMWETGNHICAECLWYKEGFEDGFVMNYHIIMMIAERGNQVLFHRLSCSPLTAPALGSEWVPQAKGAAKAEAKEWEVAGLWLNILKASANAAERVGAGSKLTQKNRWWQPCSSPRCKSEQELNCDFHWQFDLCYAPKAVRPCPAPHLSVDCKVSAKGDNQL